MFRRQSGFGGTAAANRRHDRDHARRSGHRIGRAQVGVGLRLFVVDVSPVADEVTSEAEMPAQPMVFINPELVDQSGDLVEFEEGCLSIPDMRELVIRRDRVQVRYLDRTFAEQECYADGILARVVQHEYDHLDGILFIDKISSFKRQLLRRRLREMSRGDVVADYPLAQVVA